MKTLILTLFLMILFSSISVAQSGLMIQLNMQFNNDGIKWNKELIIFKNCISLGLTVDINETKIGYSIGYFPLKFQNKKISPQLKIKNFFDDKDYDIFIISAIVRKDYFAGEIGYDVIYKNKDSFKIGLSFVQDYNNFKEIQ